jgi:hypothetical protein
MLGIVVEQTTWVTWVHLQTIQQQGKAWPWRQRRALNAQSLVTTKSRHGVCRCFFEFQQPSLARCRAVTSGVNSFCNECDET